MYIHRKRGVKHDRNRSIRKKAKLKRKIRKSKLRNSGLPH
jgi:hypothetical protein